MNYSEEDIVTLSPRDHVRLRPGMYIGKLGDGSEPDDGIYVLMKEVVDNSIDEFLNGFGKKVEITLSGNTVTVRDYGRGIPLGKLAEAVSVMNTGSNYQDDDKKTVGLNGVGVKAVNYLSESFSVRSVRDGKSRMVSFCRGEKVSDEWEEHCTDKTGTTVSFTIDKEIFGDYAYDQEYILKMVRNYTYLNVGLTIIFNDVVYSSRNGLLDLINESMQQSLLYQPIHLKGKEIEIVLSHSSGYGESFYSFVNGQYTSAGGTHLTAYREALVKVIRNFYHKEYDAADIRSSIVAAIAIRVSKPLFESATKIKLGSRDMAKEGPTIRQYVQGFLAKELDNYLHRNPEAAEALQQKIQSNEKSRKAISDIRKSAKEAARKTALNNVNLRDCQVHLTDSRNKRAEESTIFITEGKSASGSITSVRDTTVQAVFSLRGKPYNCFNQDKSIVYKNDELNFLQAALGVDDGIEGLRYNKVVIATDADVDGMHIRLLLLTFFLQFFPELVHTGHVYVLQTPLFRVRNNRKTYYCYSEKEKFNAMAACGKDPEVTRFKGLGEIDPIEFVGFIGEAIRLDRVRLSDEDPIREMLSFYMGANSDERRDFIFDNLKIEKDLIEDDLQISEEEQELVAIDNETLNNFKPSKKA